MLYSVADANRLIERGDALHIAGDEAVLRRLSRGSWVGGTIPYFLTEQGGCVDRERLFVTPLPSEARELDIGFVTADRLQDIVDGAPAHGFSLIVMPAGSDVHVRYAVNAHDLPGIFESPVIGWVAGVHLDALGRQTPKVFDGHTGEAADDCIVVLRVHLPEAVSAQVGIINLFEQGEGDRFRFPETGFSANDCLINGSRGSFYDYTKSRQLDLRLPLVTDMSGELINVSFQAVDEAKRSVRFYAPVLAGVEYRQARPLADYQQALLAHVGARPVTPAFSCNCILNYLYADLQGDRQLSITGPATFGEIAYVLLNQTLVYLELVR